MCTRPWGPPVNLDDEEDVRPKGQDDEDEAEGRGHGDQAALLALARPCQGERSQQRLHGTEALAGHFNNSGEVTCLHSVDCNFKVYLSFDRNPLNYQFK